MAIDDLLDEHEQGEKVRGWLRENGAGLIGGVLLGLGLIAGWQWWQKQQGHRRIEAGQAYQAAVDDVAAGKLQQAQPQISAMQAGTYAALARLALAKAQLDAGQRDAAITTLRGVDASDPALEDIVTRRMARLLIDAGKASEALKLLPVMGTDAEAMQVRGDALLALGKRNEARDAYVRALGYLDTGSPQRRLLELKLSEVGGTPAKPEATS